MRVQEFETDLRFILRDEDRPVRGWYEVARGDELGDLPLYTPPAEPTLAGVGADVGFSCEWWPPD